MDCLFVYIGENPIIKRGRAPNQHQLETRFVNGYCDEILFTADGHFVNLSPFTVVGCYCLSTSGVTVYPLRVLLFIHFGCYCLSTSGVTVYFFHFEDCIPCSSVEEFKGVNFSKKPPPIYIQLLKWRTIFLHWQTLTQDV